MNAKKVFKNRIDMPIKIRNLGFKTLNYYSNPNNYQVFNLKRIIKHLNIISLKNILKTAQANPYQIQMSKKNPIK